MSRLILSTTTALILSLTMAPVQGSCQSELACGFTYHQIQGNRFVSGQGSMPEMERVQIPLPQTPLWLVAAPVELGVIWVTVLADGSVQGFRSQGSQIETIPVDPPQLPIDQPPLLQVDSDRISLLTVADPEASDLTHGLPTEQGTVWISETGDLRLGSQRISTQALPDARIIGAGSDRWLLLSGTDDQRYRHGVLGDSIEATQLLMISTFPHLRTLWSVDLPAPEVIEGIAPLWADLDGQPGQEVIVTLSDPESGGQIGVFDERGQELIRGPGFGQGNRWRHPIAVAPLGPDGEVELAVVRTPHIGGVAEFYQWPDPSENDSQLAIVARQPGFTSHVIGSRNLDMGVAGDFNGDAQPELVLPSQDLRSLSGIQRTPEGTEVIWSEVLGTELTTNLAAVQTESDQLQLGIGTQRGLQLWLTPD